MRYVSKDVISFSLRIKGRNDSVRIRFSNHSNGGSTFSTDEAKVIEAMEKSPMYGKVYRRAPECAAGDVKPKKAAAKKARTEVAEVQSWQDAVEYLTANHGSDASKLGNPSLILREAEKVGVAFPNL